MVRKEVIESLLTLAVELEGPVAGVDGDGDGTNIGNSILKSGLITARNIDETGVSGTNVTGGELAATVLNRNGLAFGEMSYRIYFGGESVGKFTSAV
jgi:hypothetical protein